VVESHRLGKGFVVFDPSRGQNRFSYLGDFLASVTTIRFEVESAFLQRFRPIADGVTFQQVFTGATAAPLGGESNVYRQSGTLGIAIRQYAEGKGFEPFPLPDQEMFFRSEPRWLTNAGFQIQTAVKWNIHPGMKPIRWLISEHVARVQQVPPYSDYDLVGAVKAGITNWNKAFGFTVFEAEQARPDQTSGDDDLNYLVWDESPAAGFAFANWRTNPNSGEIRGASVYMSQVFLDDAVAFIDADPGALVPQPRPARPTLQWDAMPHGPGCVYWAPRHQDRAERGAGLGALAARPLTKKQKVEAFITHVILHEIGHTLGLRHNFKGSLLPPSSSAMDYLLDEDSIDTAEPGSYDVDAVRYLYGLSTAAPAQPFCNDGDLSRDPMCTQFDAGADPLREFHIPTYAFFRDAFLQAQTNATPNNSLNNVLRYVRAGGPADAADAWAATVDGLAAPLAPALAADPDYAFRADFLARRVISRLYLDPAAARGQITNFPSPASGAMPGILGQLSGNLVNADAIRSFTTRRACVDALKEIQTTPALGVLVSGRADIAAQRSSLTGNAALLTDDLLFRVDAATQPYFR